MKTLTLIFCLIFLTLAVKGQGINNNLTGKWKAVASNNGIYYDYLTDSSFITKKLSFSLFARPDSAKTVSRLTSFAREYKGHIFIFTTEGNYLEYHNQTLQAEGKYDINHAHGSIDLVLKKGNKHKNSFLMYKFINNRLLILVPDIPSETFLEVTLEKFP